MVFTDTHTHLYVEQFKGDRDEVIRRAIQAGVKRFFLPAIDSTYTDEMMATQQRYPDHIFLMTGLHPTHVGENNDAELEHVRKILETEKVYAVGEIGIDLYWDTTFLKEQQDVFSHQIALAKEFHLPIVIHCRNSFDEIFEVLEGHRGPELRGIFHCFTGNEDQARQAISLNMKLGIGGVVTYKNSGLDKVLKKIEPEHLVLETDSPYLAPVPYRGKRNESAYLVEVAKKVAEIYELPLEEIGRITTSTAKNVFGI